VTQAYRFELDANNKTSRMLAGHAGAARFAFNWGLATVIARLEARRAFTVLALRQGASAADAEVWAASLVGPVPWSLPALRREWNRVKDQLAPWWADYSKEAYSSGLDNLARALKGSSIRVPESATEAGWDGHGSRSGAASDVRSG
jgi:putative transposase